MKLTSKQYAQALYDAITETSPKDQDMVLDRFVKILAQNGDLNKYEEIEKAFHILLGKAKGVAQAEVKVAREMEINSQLINQLNQVVGSKLHVTTKVDESIVGGVVVKVDETLIDASVKTQLTNLNLELKK